MSDSFLPAGYRALIEQHKLILLKKPADLVLENGNIAVTRWREPSLGTPAFNGILRFFNEWRYSEPILHRMFDDLTMMAKREETLRSQEEALSIGLAGADEEDLEVRSREYHENRDELRSLEQGRTTYSEAIIIKLSALLQQIKNDVGASVEDWNTTPPIFGGHSLGQIIVAAGNCIRHRDEWIKAEKLDKRQQASRTILEAVLYNKRKGVDFLGTVPQETIILISGGAYDMLNAYLLAFAHELAQRREAKEE